MPTSSMTHTAPLTIHPRNRILAALPGHEYARVAQHLTPMTFNVRDLIYDVDKPITHVYFVNTGVASVISLMADGSGLEVATIGYEGMVGIAVFHRTDRTAAQAFWQVGGDALCMPSGEFLMALERAPTLNTLLHRYTQALFTQVAQASACNRLHQVRQRCARWLLQTHDRTGTDDFPLTHDFLAQMLGVRRASVTEAAATLQREGLIEYAYGRVTIKDRAALQRTACECYAIIVREYDRLLEGGTAPMPLRDVVMSDGRRSVVGAPEIPDENEPAEKEPSETES